MILEGLRSALSKFFSSDKYELAVEEFVKELQKELIKADVNVSVVVDISRRVRERALKEEPPAGVSRREWFVTIVYEELTKLFGGGESASVKPPKRPWTILLVGLQGSGKTTTAAKLAYFYKLEGYRAGLVAADTFRPAAYEQLRQLGEQVGVPVYGEPGGKDAVEIARRGVQHFSSNKFDVIIIDSAGRHHREEALLEEMREMSKSVNPDEVMLVIDAAIGQQAYSIAKKFHEATPIGSIVVTKLDGTAKGGGALSAVAATRARIKFVGTGEKVDEIEVFDPQRFVARVLGIGDLKSLLERVRRLQIEFTEKDLEDFVSGRINMRLIYKQLVNVRRLGPFRRILQMIPGLGLRAPLDLDPKELEGKVSKWIYAIDSMTYEELDSPEAIDRSRMRRIALGSGVEVETVRDLLKQYSLMKKLSKQLKRNKDLLKKLEEGFKLQQ